LNADRLEQIKAQGARAAAAEARALTAEQRAAEAAKIDGALASASAAYQQGPEAFAAWTQQNAAAIQESGLDPSQITHETFPMIAAGLVGAREGLTAGAEFAEELRPEEIMPMSPEGKLMADLQAGRITQEQFNAANQKSGMRVAVGPDGQMTFEQGPGVAGGNVKFTEGQSKDNVYATRARGALEVLEPVASALTRRGERAAELVPLGIGREFQSDDYQVAQQAGTEFLQAILRKDTGAAITQGETESYGRTYLPQPGDSDAVLETKRQARIRAINAIESGMSAAQMLARDRALINAAAESGDAAPAVQSTQDRAATTEGVSRQIQSIPDFGSMSDEQLDAWLAENGQ